MLPRLSAPLNFSGTFFLRGDRFTEENGGRQILEDLLYKATLPAGTVFDPEGDVFEADTRASIDGVHIFETTHNVDDRALIDFFIAFAERNGLRPQDVITFSYQSMPTSRHLDSAEMAKLIAPLRDVSKGWGRGGISEALYQDIQGRLPNPAPSIRRRRPNIFNTLTGWAPVKTIFAWSSRQTRS